MTTRRAQRAEATRGHILDAARTLFARQGYRATTVADIAAAADVAVQTIYDSVGSKAALVVGLNDRIREQAGVAELAAELGTSDDPQHLVAIPPLITRRILETSGDIVRASFGAADAEPELARVRDEGTRRHRDAMRRIALRLAELDALAPGTDPEDAADTLAVLTQPETWLVLLDRYGWDLDRAEAWACDSLARLVLAPAATAAGR